MKQYPKYKNSEIEYIGEIPQHWEVWKLKFLVMGKLKYGANEAAELEDRNLPRYIRITDFDNNGKLKEDTFKSLPSNIAKEYLLKNGDILFARSGATVGKTLLFDNYDGQACFAGYLIKATCHEQKINYKFLDYYTCSSSYENWKDMIFIQATIQNIGADKYNVLLVPKTNLQEQQIIVKYLDFKANLIDSFILNRQTQIELLKEQLHFKINEAITKGINQKIKFKPTDIKYVPEIPEHWDIRKFKSLTSILTCGYASTPEYVDESVGVPFLSAQNCRPFRMDLSKYNYIKKQLHKQLTRYKKPQRGDVLVTRVGAGIGQACIIDTDLEFSVYVSLTHIRPSKEILSEYIVYFFNTEYCYQLNHEGTVVGGGQGNLNVKNVERYRIPLPPVEEQKEIIAYLDNYRTEMDTLISKYQKQIDLMQEYRTAIISQAVTGKIDVRDWQPKTKEIKS